MDRRRSKLIGIAAGVIVVIIIIVFAIVGSCSGNDDITQAVAQRPALEVTEYPHLVNSEYTLSSTYSPTDLVALTQVPDGHDCYLRQDAASAYVKMHEAMCAEGMSVLPLSGYRTYKEQQNIYDYNVELHMAEGMTREEAIAYTDKFVARPGTSEHQYGCSIDVTTDGTTQHDFHETEQGKWLIANAGKYGFVIRYEQDKESITGISYEPWHLRYVGEEAAMYMTTWDLCLEEYVELARRESPGAVMSNEY